MSDFIELKWKKGKVKIYLLGCMMVPEFYHKDKIISPLHTCQWPDKDPKKFSQLPGILRNLRGDFPCVPFGINTPIENISEDWKKSYSEEPYIVNDPHGYSANNIWNLEKLSSSSASFKIIYPENDYVEYLERTISIENDERSQINCSLNIVVKKDCQLPIGFHPMINIPEEKNKIKIFPGNFKFGLTYPGLFLPGRSLGAIGKEFQSIKEVEGFDGKIFDLSQPPFSGNFEDLFQLCGIDGNISIENYLDNYKFSYKWNPNHFSSLLMWVSNKGRTEYPWNEKNLTVGLEPITSAFGLSTHVSGNKENPINKKGVPTVINLYKKNIWKTSYSFLFEEI